MAVSQNTGGTKAADGSEQTLATITSAGTYQLIVDLTNMANGDELELRIDVKPLTGSTAATVFFASYKHAQGPDSLVALSPPVPAPFSFAATLKQTAGTNRNYDWAIYEY